MRANVNQPNLEKNLHFIRVNDLDMYIPRREIAGFDGVLKIQHVPVWFGPSYLSTFGIGKITYALV